MKSPIRSSVVLGVLLLTGLAVSAAPGQTPPQDASPPSAQFQRGYFLQVHEHDYNAAAAAFKQVVADADVSQPTLAEAKLRLAQCQEEAVAADLAALVPPDALAYVELARPGEHLARLLNMLGLQRDSNAPPTELKPGAVPLGGGFYLPNDLALSPALIAEAKKFGGAAAAITGIDRQGVPQGILVLHPGDADLVRGVLETALQANEPAEPIEGFRTYHIQREVWVTQTARLIIASRSREQVAAAVARLRDRTVPSLAAQADFARLGPERESGLLFGYVNGPQAIARLSPLLARGEEVAMARLLIDLDHVQSLVFSVGATENSLQCRTQWNMMPGHQSLAFSLARTAPVTRQSLARVPQGIAALALVGLNPARGAAEGKAGSDTTVSAMDLGREIFANLEEIAVFALPPGPSKPGQPRLPEIGLSMAVGDAAKTEALWNQALTLATMVGARAPQPAGEITLDGHLGHIYRIPGGPAIVVVRAGDRAVVAGTETAVTAALRAAASGETIDRDAAFAPLLKQISADTSQAVLVDVGRAVQLGAGLPNGKGFVLGFAGSIVKDLRLSLVSDHGPNQLAVRGEATGLPNVQAILRMLTGASSTEQATAAVPASSSGGQ